MPSALGLVTRTPTSTLLISLLLLLLPGLLLLHGGERRQGGGAGRRDQGRPRGDQQILEPEETNKT